MQVFRDIQDLPKWQRAVITIGSFDGVHNGHRSIIGRLIEQAKAVQGISVLITFEPHPRLVLSALNGVKTHDSEFLLLNTLEEKIAILSETGLDCLVVVPFDEAFSKMSAEAYLTDFIWAKFHPHTILIGYDHRFGNDRSGGIETLLKFAEGENITIIEITAQQVNDVTVSSTKIRNALLSGALETANQLLDRPYLIKGEVVYGDQIGRTIAYPTANIAAKPYKLLPLDGIYAALVTVHEKTYQGMLYIGHRPSLAGKNEQRIEVHLLDFQEDIYGVEIKIEILKYIRPDKKLDGISAVKTQIDADRVQIKAFFQEQQKPNLDTAIVILNYNTVNHLADFLPSVKANSQGARIIVADNGSPDQSVAYLREQHPDVEVLDLGVNHGFAGGYNEALKSVKAEYYVILNSDVEVTPGWLNAPLHLLQNDPSIAVVQPKIKAYRRKTHFEYAGAAGGWIDALGYPYCRGRIFSNTEADLGQYDQDQECFWAAGAAFFIRAKLYHEFEGFDYEYFAHNEEIDLCWRIKRAGYRILCTHKSVVYHLGGGTLEYESPRKVFLNFRNSLYTLVKNMPISRLIWAIPSRLVLDGLAGFRFLLKGQFRAIFAIIEAHFSFYGNLGNTLKKRAHIAQLVKQNAIGPTENLVGMSNQSAVFLFYAFGKKTFAQLMKTDRH
jgi:riboflavin kinase/FMN adenylyltransferase